jgi:hypothetical protein
MANMIRYPKCIKMACVPTYGADEAGHVIDDAAGQVERDVRLHGHQIEDDLAGEAGHVAAGTGGHSEEGWLAR